MNFKDKIEELRNHAQEKQSATKIVDGIKKLYNENDINSSYRWVWELIQNAKDVCNNTGKVNIRIELNTEDKELTFSHNGKLFNTQNVVYLIEQVSSKERSKGVKTTGKFGTGFLTTHLLSKKVELNGYIQDEGDNPYSFITIIDRDSTNIEYIMKSIATSCNELSESAVEYTLPINENDYNTCFTYKLDDNGIKTAKLGLDNLLLSAPYVFASIENLSVIEVHYDGFIRIIERDSHSKFGLSNTFIDCVKITTENIATCRNVLSYKDDKCQVMLELDSDISKNEVLQYEDNMPKLFCDFPLLGSEDFAFPVIVNSSYFNPTEPRDGLLLKDLTDDDNKENYEILDRAVEIYGEILEYLVDCKYDGLYNITKILQGANDDFNRRITNKLKASIMNHLLIETYYGDFKALESWDDDNILIAKDESEDIRNQVWQLTSYLSKNNIVKKNKNNEWYNSLWDDQKNYGLQELIVKVESFANIYELEESIVPVAAHDFLNDLISLYRNYKRENKDLLCDPKIFPNQNGLFCTEDQLRFDVEIEGVYKDITKSLGIDLRANLFDKLIVDDEIRVNSYTHKDLFDELDSALNSDISFELLREIACLSTKSNQYESPWFLCMIEMYGQNDWGVVKVNEISTKIKNKVIKYLIDIMFKHVEACEGIEILCFSYEFATVNQIYSWYNRMIGMFVKINQVDMLNNFKIFPDQNGRFMFVHDLFADSNDYADIYKDILKIIGQDVRAELIDTEIAMPHMHTKSLDDYAPIIVDYVREHKNNLGNNDDEIKLFMKLYTELKKYKDEGYSPKYFKELVANLYWFFNENQMSQNYDKIQELDEILKENNIGSLDDLKDILSNSSKKDQPKTIINDDFLASWGITSQEELDKILKDKTLDYNFIHDSKLMPDRFNYVQGIVKRAKERIFEYLKAKDEYDFSDMTAIGKTIFQIRKNGEEIFIITRPSDFNKVILYYESEFDTLDYEKDWELWVEDNKSEPQKITFGKILKITGVNKLPLWKLK